MVVCDVAASIDFTKTISEFRLSLSKFPIHYGLEITFIGFKD